MCFTNCPKANIPECNKNENCNFSCILRCFGHIKYCDICLKHVDAECQLRHCQKIRILWKLRCEIIEFMLLYDLNPHSSEFRFYIDGFNYFSLLDYNEIKYNGSEKKTKQLFEFFEIFQRFTKNINLLFLDGSKITRAETKQCFDYIVRNDLEHYFF